MSVLSRAYELRPEENANPEALQALSDWALIAYARGLLSLLEARPEDDEAAAEIRDGLGQIFPDKN